MAIEYKNLGKIIILLVSKCDFKLKEIGAISCHLEFLFRDNELILFFNLRKKIKKTIGSQKKI